MADMTSWAQAQLPSNRNLGVESMLRSAAIGQAVGQGQREAQKQASIQSLRNKILDSYKAQDRPGMMYAISELAAVDPESAQASRDVYNNLDRTNAFQAAMLVYTAAASDTEEAQNAALRQALDVMQVGPEHPFYQELTEILNMPFGKTKDNALIGAVKGGQILGFFPTKEEMYSLQGGGKAGGKDDTLDWRKFYQTAENQRVDNDRLERQLKLEQRKQTFTEKEAELKRTTLSSEQTKLIDGWNTVSANDEAKYQDMIGLAKQWESPELSDKRRGMLGSIGDVLRNILGVDDTKVDFMLQDFNKHRNRIIRDMITETRPTDFDFKVTERGTPPVNASPKRISQWLRGAAKLNGVSAAYSNAQADYMEQRVSLGKDFKGFRQYWDKYGDWYITRIIGDPVDENGKPIERKKPPEEPPLRKFDTLTPEQRAKPTPIQTPTRPEIGIPTEIKNPNQKIWESIDPSKQKEIKERGVKAQETAKQLGRSPDTIGYNADRDQWGYVVDGKFISLEKPLLPGQDSLR